MKEFSEKAKVITHAVVSLWGMRINVRGLIIGGLLVYFSLLSSSVAFSQYDLNDSLVLHAPGLRESFMLATDRDVYATGELINFRAFNTSSPELTEQSWSRVLYLELINHSGQPVMQAKYPADGQGAVGSISIIDTLSTGIYHIRVYTKWMRNFSPRSYTYIPVLIVNPRKPSDAPLALMEEDRDSTSLVQAIAERSGLIIRMDNQAYGKREKVKLELSLSSGEWEGKRPFCISVIRKGSLDPGLWGMVDRNQTIHPLFKTIRYLPETRGISMTGRLFPANGEDRIGSAEVHMTLLGAEPDYVGFHSDIDGNIHQALPGHFGAQEVLMAVNHPDPVRIELDGEFSTENLPAGEMPGMLLSRRQPAIIKMMINAQLQQAFPSVSVADDSLLMELQADTIPFYHQADRRLLTSDYVELPTLEEFFFELIPEVSLRKSGGTREFVIYPYTGRRSLVLLDYVAITDFEDFLRIPPARIRYIDVIGRAYQRGENYYDGIISVISKDGDLGGIDLPENSAFFHFKSFHPVEGMKYPDYALESGKQEIPDVRNTLFWKPDLFLDAAGSGDLSFYTSDIPGIYQIVVRGIDPEGQPVISVDEFLVE